MEALTNLVLLTLLAATVIAMARLRSLLAVVVLGGIFSFLMATVLIVLDAPDVAMTEAAVGAGISTVLLLGALHLTGTEEAAPRRSSLIPLFVAFGTAAVLVWGTGDLPAFGSADAPVHTAGPDYMARSVAETGIPNVVTAVLASYRGFDTLGETAVIFTAGIGVLLLLRRPRRKDVDEASAARGTAPGKHGY